MEDSNLYDNSDWTDFRNAFGLSKYKSGSLKVVHPAPIGGKACGNPGDNSDDDEATIDAEWASAAAPDATILVATCKATQTTDGVHLAIENLVNSENPPRIISISFGACETSMPQTLRVAFKHLYQQAVTEGISVFVAADWGSALSYIPEIPWNDTCASTLTATYYGFALTYGSAGFCNSPKAANLSPIMGTNGGPSTCATGDFSKNPTKNTCKGYPKPSWQSGVIGIPTMASATFRMFRCLRQTAPLGISPTLFATLIGTPMARRVRAIL